jgi:hypothetical protein
VNLVDAKAPFKTGLGSIETNIPLITPARYRDSHPIWHARGTAGERSHPQL